MINKKRVIVLGASGNLAYPFIEYLLSKKYYILAISSKKIPNNLKNKNGLIWYKKNKLISSKFLKSIINKNPNFNNKNTNLYIFSWKGEYSLTSGDLKIQIKNLNFLELFFSEISKLEINRIIRIGSSEELVINSFLEDKWNNIDYFEGPIPYTLTKLYSSYISHIMSYLTSKKIIHILFSTYYREEQGFISKNLVDIKNNNYNSKLINRTEPIDILNLYSLIKKIALIGQNNNSKNTYLIQSDKWVKLKKLFSLCNNKKIKNKLNYLIKITEKNPNNKNLIKYKSVNATSDVKKILEDFNE